MIEANLSHAHHLIEQYNEKTFKAWQQIQRQPLKHDFKIYELSAEADFTYFREQLAKTAAAQTEQLNDLLKMLDYCEYLKNLIADANAKIGINAKLTRVNTLTKQIRFYEDYTALVRSDHESNLEPVKNVEFYKSALTDQIRVYNLPVYLYNEETLKQFEARLNALKTELQSLNDQIAGLNQKNTIEIHTFEEFKQGI